MSTMDLGYLAHPEGDKCFKVSYEYEGHSIFVWARFNAEARREGANLLDTDWDSVSCSRFKELDTFEGDLLTWCLDRGWYFECAQCDRHTGLEYDPPCVVVRGSVFCSEEHAETYHAHWDAVRALETRFLAYAKERFPEEEPTHAYVNVEGDCVISTNRGCRIIDKSDLPPETLPSQKAP